MTCRGLRRPSGLKCFPPKSLVYVLKVESSKGLMVGDFSLLCSSTSYSAKAAKPLHKTIGE